MKTLIAAGLLAGATLMGAVTAHADSIYGYHGDQDGSAYQHELSDAGVSTTSVAEAVALGRKVCLARDSGVSELHLLDSISRAYNYTQASTVVHGGEWHFCPTYY
jgi:hypothetical protein